MNHPIYASATRWVCTQCHRQFSGAKSCSFCRSALFSVPLLTRGMRDGR
ncbi:putative zinc ribbon protein [Lelliottia sp. SL45]